MDKLEIYRKIRDIAHKLQQSDGFYTRADLAYDLQKLGIQKDSIEVGILAWEAYNYFKKDVAIKSRFYDNERKELLVPKYQVDVLIERNDNDSLFPLLQQKLSDGDQALKTLNQIIAQELERGAISSGADLFNTIVGTKGTVKVQNEATAIFNNYSLLTSKYDDAKQQIKSVMTDFAKLRGQICNIYRQYSIMLIDTFGDSIKAVSPELFDFESVEWLDIQGMLQNIKLEYDKITEKCSLLMSDISDNFNQSLQNASASARAAGSKQIGLVIAGLNMIAHYVDAKQKTTELQQELLSLKNSAKHDVTLIKGDLGRLLVIYKTLNDLYIPKSETFCRFSNQVLSKEWQQLEEALYATPEIKELKQQRDCLLNESKELEKNILDAEMNISYYTTRIDECKQLLNGMQAQYEQAKRDKPEKPFFLKNIFTLGAAGKAYNRHIYEWNLACKPVITRFDELQVDVKLDSDELSLHQAELTSNRKRHEELKHELRQLNRRIMSGIKVNPTIRLNMLKHLEDMIKLLRLAREIAGSKLDAKLTKTVSITRQDVTLPPELSRNINTFAQTVREQIGVDGQEGYPQTATGEELDQVTAAANKAIQDTVDLFEKWSHLQAMKERSAIANKAYDAELTRLQEAFRQTLAEIDNKSAVVCESIKRINTAQSHDQLKAGLLSLAGKDDVFTESDWEDFLNGNKTIEL